MKSFIFHLNLENPHTFLAKFWTRDILFVLVLADHDLIILNIFFVLQDFFPRDFKMTAPTLFDMTSSL